MYKLRVEFKNGDCWFIFRRYTDFSRLYGQLKRQKAPISHLILPRKKWLGDNFAPNFLEERIRGLQAFVNGLLNSPDLVTLSCVREFFCLDEPPTLSDTVEESRVSFSISKLKMNVVDIFEVNALYQLHFPFYYYHVFKKKDNKM